MKKIRTLIIFAAVLALLIAGYAVVTLLQKQDDAPEEEAPALVATEMEESSISAIDYSYAGSNVSLQKSGSGWVWTENEALPLKQDLIEKMVSTIVSVPAVREVAPVADGLSEFGFDEPSVSVDVTSSDGKTFTYSIGDLNPVTMNYYFYRSDGESVWLVESSVLTAFTKTFDDLITLDVIPSSEAENFLSYTLASPFSSLKLTTDDTGVEGYHRQYSWYASKNGSSPYPVDSVSAEQFADTAVGLSFEGFADYAPSSEKLSLYGLDEGSKTDLTVSYLVSVDSGDGDASYTLTSEKSYTVSIGASAEDGGGVYARLDGSEMICTISSADAALLLSYPNADLTPRDVFGVDFTYVAGMTLAYQGKEYAVAYDEDADLYRIGEQKTTSVEDFSAFYTPLEDLRAQIVDPGAEKGDPVFSLTLDTLDANGDPDTPVTLEIFRSGENYLAEFDSHTGLVLSASDVDPILEKLESILK